VINKQINTKQNYKKGKVLSQRYCMSKYQVQSGETKTNIIMWTGGQEQCAIGNTEIEREGECSMVVLNRVKREGRGA
jgi:hypothetical protein